MKDYTLSELDAMIPDFKEQVYDKIPEVVIKNVSVHDMALGWALGRNILPFQARYLANMASNHANDNWIAL